MLFKGDYKDYLNYDGFKTHVIGTQLKFTLFPRKCYLTQQWLWLEKTYKQTAMWTGPGDPVFEYRWYKKEEFIKARLKDLV